MIWGKGEAKPIEAYLGMRGAGGIFSGTAIKTSLTRRALLRTASVETSDRRVSRFSFMLPRTPFSLTNHLCSRGCLGLPFWVSGGEVTQYIIGPAITDRIDLPKSRAGYLKYS